MPESIPIMIELCEQTGVLAAVNTIRRSVPAVTLLNDSSVCGANGQVCGHCPEEPACATDTNSDGTVNVVDVLAILAAFGSTC